MQDGDRNQQVAPLTWRDVQHAEEKVLDRNGTRRESSGRIGLALSGGGIRSATFSLGVLQYLANRKGLRQIDYLSTVSGGGYIGAWLSALIRRKSGCPPGKEGTREVRWDDVEQEVKNPQSLPIRWIREHGSYLTPLRGLSGDMVSTIGLILTNLLVSIAVVASLVALVALLSLLFGTLFVHLSALMEYYPLVPPARPDEIPIPWWPDWFTYPRLVKFVAGFLLLAGFLLFLDPLRTILGTRGCGDQAGSDACVRYRSGVAILLVTLGTGLIAYLFVGLFFWSFRYPNIMLRVSGTTMVLATVLGAYWRYLAGMQRRAANGFDRTLLVGWVFLLWAGIVWASADLALRLVDPGNADTWPEWLNSSRLVWIISGLCFLLGMTALVEPVREIYDQFRFEAAGQDSGCSGRRSRNVAMSVSRKGGAILSLSVALVAFSLVMTYAISRGSQWPRILPENWLENLYLEGAVFFGFFLLFVSLPMQVLSWRELAEEKGRFSHLSATRKLVNGGLLMPFTWLAGCVGGMALVLLVTLVRGDPDDPGLSGWIGQMAGVAIALSGLIIALSVQMLLLGRGLPPLLREWWHPLPAMESEREGR